MYFKYSLETIPMILFSKIIQNKDLSLLTNEKEMSEEKLQELWNNIREDYTKHEDSLKNKKIDELKRKISKESGKYQTIIMALEVLKYGSDDDMLKIIESYGYRIVGDYYSGLEQVYKQVANLKNKIEGLQKELEGFLTSNSDEKDEISIYEVLINLAIGLELPLDIKNMTAMEYIYYQKALRKKIEALNKK